MARSLAAGLRISPAMRQETSLAGGVEGAREEDAIERLIELIRKAAEKPKTRRRTRATLASKRRRLESKRRRGETKRMRRPLAPSQD